MDRVRLELFESAKKVADAAADDGVKSGGSEETRCVDTLKQLKKVPVTMQVLVQTQTVIAKEWHFAFCTPLPKTASLGPFTPDENSFSNQEVPNAPKLRRFKHHVNLEKFEEIKSSGPDRIPDITTTFPSFVFHSQVEDT